jgi:hypothetical protein
MGTIDFSTLTRKTKEEEIQGREKLGKETGQKGEEKEATQETHTTTEERDQERILTRGINPGGIHERVKDSRKGPLIRGINNLLKEHLVMQVPRPRPLQPSSAGSTTKDMEERKETTTPITMDLTPKDMQQTALATLETPGTEGPRESATMTMEPKTP